MEAQDEIRKGEITNLKAQVEILSNDKQSLVTKVNEQDLKLASQSKRLDEIKYAVIELSSRPCAC